MLSLIRLVAAELLDRSREALLTARNRERLRDFEAMRQDRDQFERRVELLEPEKKAFADWLSDEISCEFGETVGVLQRVIKRFTEEGGVSSGT